MEKVPVSVLGSERCHLGEGPSYDAATDTAWWFDILEGKLFEAHLASGHIRIHSLGRMGSALARIDVPHFLDSKTWMAGSNPAMTDKALAGAAPRERPLP